jgi:hypothetical protein
MDSVNKKLNNWISKTDDHSKLSKEKKLKHILLCFDDNYLN